MGFATRMAKLGAAILGDIRRTAPPEDADIWGMPSHETRAGT